jgi:hypothetical protein
VVVVVEKPRLGKALNLVWTKHLNNPDDKEKLEQSIRASTTMAHRLREILEEEERQLDAAVTLKDFEDPSWSHKQAFRSGEKARIRKLKELLDFY